MIWVVLLILAIIAAYFIHQGLRARRISRHQHENGASQNVSNSVTELDAQHSGNTSDFKQDTAGSQNSLSGQALPAPHDSPSLLYADRNNAIDLDSAAPAESLADSSADKAITPNTGHHSGDHTSDRLTSGDTLDLTAETLTLSIDDVGIPANSSEYEQVDKAETIPPGTHNQPSVSDGSVAANASHMHSNDYQPTHEQHSPSNVIAAGAVAAGIASVATLATHSNIHTQSDSSQPATKIQNAVKIDLELDASTHSDIEYDKVDHDEHDELLDFGDMTVDISEMIKELNLRETDSPRLDINEKEYQQLKTGNPGEVKPEKIENVAGKLRDMLQ